eukprot:CAMPEP_0175497094 /NCGR_PEP_ID=MMETSP0096-20121207/4631_1 /TAXON_ID=311494 /ORGANISM="Alexandrium monilatum, Strain CCMP3105" /LENGTH=305 /DNA_ID=CAMNT_0016799099 /DNA_START=360 /DNA_END=1278 /DNA_ORIENTATION=+
MEELAPDLLQGRVLLQAGPDDVCYVLVGTALKETVASHHEELLGPPVEGRAREVGVAITFCFEAGIAEFALRWKSPSARDKFKVPSTRWQGPTFTTWPPAARMRLRSFGFSGLWSSERAMALPPRIRIVRESPTLATTISWFRKSTAATHAVDPTAQKGCKGPSSRRPSPQEPARSLESRWGNASSSAAVKVGARVPVLCELLARDAQTSLARMREAMAATSLPPCPSSTANSAASGKTEASSISATCASSMASRQPRMLHAAQTTCSERKVPDSTATVRSGVGPTKMKATICRTIVEPMKTTTL